MLRFPCCLYSIFPQVGGALAAIPLFQRVGMEVHRIAKSRRLQVAERELLFHVGEQGVLGDEDEMLAHMLKRLDLVM